MADPQEKRPDGDRGAAHHSRAEFAQAEQVSKPVGNDRFSLIAAGVIAALLVIGVIAFTMSPGSEADVEGTAAVPESSESQ